MSDPQPTKAVLPPTPQAPAAARELVREVCDGWPVDKVDVASVLTSEIVTNAVRHGSGDVHLRIAKQDQVLRVEVSDDDPRLPEPLPEVDPDAESGRGLRIVAALASEWGAHPRSTSEDGGGGGGKTVWFLLQGD